MGEAILVAVAFALEALCVMTGGLLVRLLSIGRWRGESLKGKEAPLDTPAGALTFVLDGQRVVSTNGLTLVGIAFYGLLAAAAYWLATG